MLSFLCYASIPMLPHQTIWAWLIELYVAGATLTFVPTLRAFIAPVELHDGGASFDKSGFTAAAKTKLKHHYSRLQGTLGFWKKEATKNQRFHYYALSWSIVSSTLVPFLTQAIDEKDPTSKWLLTVIAAHVALILAFHRGFKVEERFRAFRHGESEFYDTYRRMLDRPETFGTNEAAQLKKYFEEVEFIRKFVRNAETNSLPSVEDVREKIAKPDRAKK